MKKTFIILFVLVPALITSSIFIIKDNELSTQENRTLMTSDSISHNIKDGSFQGDFETYLSDQFIFREKLIWAQTGIRYLAGQRDIGGAYICKNGRLIQKITNSDVDKSQLEAYAKKINRIAGDYKVYVMLVPSAGCVLKDELPDGAPMYDYDGIYNSLSTELNNANMIDIKAALSLPDCYYKTDHHWNALGAYNAYNAFCEAKHERAAALESFNLKSVSTDFQGTLFSKVPISKEKDEILLPENQFSEVTADGVKADFYDMKALESKDKYNVFQGGNHGICEIENKNAKSDKTLLILKDSFANSFVPYIAGDYKKIILLDERYTFVSLEDYVKTLNPDEILVLKEITNL